MLFLDHNKTNLMITYILLSFKNPATLLPWSENNSLQETFYNNNSLL